MGAATTTRDDPGQSKRFLETARQIAADKDDSRADELMGKLAKQAPEPRKPKGEK